MPLRKFDDRDFDSFVRAKFEAAPPATFDAKAWSKLNAKRGGFASKLWISGIAVILLILAGLWWWYPFGNQSGADAVANQKELSFKSQSGTDNTSGSHLLDSSANTVATTSSQGQSKADESIQEKTLSGSGNVASDNELNNKNNQEALLDSEEQEINKTRTLQTVESNVAKKAFSSSGTSVATTQSTIESVDAKAFNSSEKDQSPGGEEKENTFSDQPADLKDDNKAVRQAYNSNSLIQKPIKGGDEVAFSKSEDKQDQFNYDGSSVMTDEMLRTKYILRHLFFRDTIFVYPISYEPIDQSEFPYYRPDDLENENTKNKEKKSLLKNRFILSLLLNTDLSTVKFDDFTNPGFGLGFRISYRISDRLLVNGGITKTTKIYDVNDREDYTLSRWILANQGWPESISAKCDITEVPIGIRYDLAKGQNWNLYGQLGLSTFLMDREIYDFQLTEAQQQAGFRDRWEVENRSKHAFNIVGATVGYERYFTRRLGVGLEVYWQTTLNGIGIYTVNLNSVGNQVMLNYRF